MSVERLYFAGYLGHEFDSDLLKTEIKHRLLSYYDLRKESEGKTKKGGKRRKAKGLEEDYILNPRCKFDSLMLDSGAYSVWGKPNGNPIILDDYISYCIAHQDKFTYFVNLDVIPGRKGQKRKDIPPQEIEEAAKKGWDNYERMFAKLTAAGITVDRLIHVFHMDEKPSWLEKMVADPRLEYIGISPSNDEKSLTKKIEWLNECKKRVCTDGVPKVKTHGFGVADLVLLRMFPWTSADATTWGKLAAMNEIFIPKERPYKGRNKWFFGETETKISLANLKYDETFLRRRPKLVRKDVIRYLRNIELTVDATSRKDVTRYLKNQGLPLGASSTSLQPKGYVPKEGERILRLRPKTNEKVQLRRYGCFKPDHRWVESKIRDGVANSLVLREYLNAHYFNQFVWRLNHKLPLRIAQHVQDSVARHARAIPEEREMVTSKAKLLRMLEIIDPALANSRSTRLRALDTAEPRLAKQEGIYPTKHYLFEPGRIFAFNGDLVLSVSLPRVPEYPAEMNLDLRGVVLAEGFHNYAKSSIANSDILNITCDDVDVNFDDEKGRRTVRIDPIPSERLEIDEPPPLDALLWQPLGEEFLPQLIFSLFSRAKKPPDPDQRAFSCIHWSGSAFVASDGKRKTRCDLSTRLDEGVQILIPAAVAKELSAHVQQKLPGKPKQKVPKYIPTAVAIGNNHWIHLKVAVKRVNEEDVDYAILSWPALVFGNYPDIGPVFSAASGKAWAIYEVHQRTRRYEIIGDLDFEEARTEKDLLGNCKVTVIGSELTAENTGGLLLRFKIDPKAAKEILERPISGGNIICGEQSFLEFWGDKWRHLLKIENC